MEPLRMALIGCGNRGKGAYLPPIRKMVNHVRLTAVCDEQEEAAREVGEAEGVPSYTSIEAMLEAESLDFVCVVVNPPRTAEAALKVIDAGVSVMTETPIATQLEDADAMIAAAREKGVKLETAENYYRRTTERIKRELILADVFGNVNVVYSDFVGHGYHGVGLLRSYIGFDVKAVRVTGYTRDYRVQNHVFRAGQPVRDTENWQHGVIEFENGSCGIFSFSSLSYGSPLRWGRSKNLVRFYAEKGMGVGEDLAILEGEDQTRPIAIEKRTIQVEGQEVLDAYVADTSPEVAWENPLREYPMSEGEIMVGSEILSIARAVAEDIEPEYGAWNGRVDREIDLAMSRSWSNGSVPVDL